MKENLGRSEEVGSGKYKAVKNGKGLERRQALLYRKVRAMRESNTDLSKYKKLSFNRKNFMQRLTKEIKPESDALQEPLNDYDKKAEKALAYTAQQVGLDEVSNINFSRKRNLFSLTNAVNY